MGGDRWVVEWYSDRWGTVIGGWCTVGAPAAQRYVGWFDGSITVHGMTCGRFAEFEDPGCRSMMNKSVRHESVTKV